jgi:hypothetical protein
MRNDLLNQEKLPLTNTNGDIFLPQTLYFDLKISITEAFEKLKNLALGVNKEELFFAGEFDEEESIIEAHIPWLRWGNEKHKTWNNTLLGELELTEGKLVVYVNSDNRAKTIKSILLENYGSFLTYKTKVIESFNLNSSSIHGRLSLDTQFTLTQSPDEKPNTAQFMNLHWQEWVNSSLEFLGKKTPKEAAKDEEGRELLESFFLNLKKNSSNFDPRLIPDIENIKELIHWDGKYSEENNSQKDPSCGRKVSEVFLEFIDPILKELGDDIGKISQKAFKKLMKLPLMIWNLSSLEDDDKKELITTLLLNNDKDFCNFLIDRKKYGFSQYKYFIKDFSLKINKIANLISKLQQ